MAEGEITIEPPAESEKPKFYPLRPGLGLEEQLATLEKSPEFSLTHEEEQHVLSFDKQLTRGSSLTIDNQGKLVEDETGSVRGIEDIYLTKINEFEFHLEHFLNDESTDEAGKAAQVDELKSVFNVTSIPKLETIAEAHSFLSRIDYSPLDTTKLKELSGKVPVMVKT